MSPSRRWFLTPRARSGLVEAVEYVQVQFGEAKALDVLQRFHDEFRRLAEFPGIGHRRPDLTNDERILFRALGPALLAYRETSRGIEILIVERAERDWSSLVN